MIIVDAHVHVGSQYYEPVESLIFQMQRNKVAKAVLIQFNGNNNQYELECVHNYPDRFAAVVLVDTQRADAPDILEKWAKEGAVGVRLWSNDRFSGSDPLAVWRRASELGLVVSTGGKVDMFASDEFRRLVEELPNLKIVMEHLAGVAPEQHQVDYELLKKVLALAKYPNVYIKLPGFGELLPKSMFYNDLPFEALPPVLRMVYEAFSSHRMMWASDFPPCGGREGYANALRLPMERIPFFSKEDKEWIFGKTALSVWKIT